MIKFAFQALERWRNSEFEFMNRQWNSEELAMSFSRLQQSRLHYAYAILVGEGFSREYAYHCVYSWNYIPHQEI